MNDKISILFSQSQELKKGFIFEKDEEFKYMADKIMEAIGYKEYSEYESLCNEYTQVAEERAYTQGFKDAFKLFMQLNS